ncbi:MAG: hypothetical protein EOO47_23750 [Flavobacterium sp.]|nr:MAG: hypothetical protein EOO47_23750 [Flavobacterium sp.]
MNKIRYQLAVLSLVLLGAACNNRQPEQAPQKDKNEVVKQMDDKYNVLYAAFDEGNKLHKIIFTDKDTSYFCTFCEDSTKFNKDVALKAVDSKDSLTQQYFVLAGRDSGGYLYVNKQTQKMEFINKSGKKQYSLDLLAEFEAPKK